MKRARRRGAAHPDAAGDPLALGAVLPAVAAAFALSFAVPLSPRVRWTVAAGIVVLTWGMLAALAEAVSRPLQTLGNLHRRAARGGLLASAPAPTARRTR